MIRKLLSHCNNLVKCESKEEKVARLCEESDKFFRKRLKVSAKQETIDDREESLHCIHKMYRKLLKTNKLSKELEHYKDFYNHLIKSNTGLNELSTPVGFNASNKYTKEDLFFEAKESGALSASIWYKKPRVPDKVSLSEFLGVVRYTVDTFTSEYDLTSYFLKSGIATLSNKKVIEHIRKHDDIENIDDVVDIYKELLFIRRRVRKLRKKLRKVHVVYR
jgi:hypothetical protein